MAGSEIHLKNVMILRTTHFVTSIMRLVLSVIFINKLPPHDPIFSYNQFYNCTAYSRTSPNWECGFHGITCNEKGIYKINLANNYLEGSIVSDIGAVGNLEEMTLDGNLLEGTLPLELGNLKFLKELSL